MIFLEVIFLITKFTVCGLFELTKYTNIVSESKDRLRISLAQVHSNIKHVAQTWPPVIFTCSNR
jgi:hypothetical protein